MTKEILDPVTVVMFSVNTYVNTAGWVVTLWPSLSDRGGCLSSWTTLQFSSFWYQNWTNPKWYVLSKIRLSAAHLKPLCVFTCPLQCVTLTIPARGWAATPPLKTLEWPSSRSSRFLRGTTGTASWRYLTCGGLVFHVGNRPMTCQMALLIGSDHVFVNIGAAASLGHAWNWNGGHLKCLVIDKNVIIILIKILL